MRNLLWYGQRREFRPPTTDLRRMTELLDNLDRLMYVNVKDQHMFLSKRLIPHESKL
jgi:hypothetical protein